MPGFSWSSDDFDSLVRLVYTPDTEFDFWTVSGTVEKQGFVDKG